MQKIKVKDKVIVIAGKDKGRTGVVTKLNFKKSMALIEGINVIKKSVKPTQENPSGGFLDVERPIHLSNISCISPKTKKATRVRIEEVKGKKVRVAVACKTVLK